MKSLIEKLLRGEPACITPEEADKMLKDLEQANIPNFDDMEMNRQYNLPFSGIGSRHSGSDYDAEQIGPNKYRVAAKDLMAVLTNPFGTSSASSLHHQAHEVDAATMRDIIDDKHLPHLNLYRMTKEESKELEQLEKDLENWKVQEDLNKFKQLPPNIRQEIVDEAIIKDLMGNLDEKVNEKEFPDYQRLDKLRRMRRPQFVGLSAQMHDNQHYGFQFKFWPILQKFTTKQLMQAHADASLEDELVE